jgi:protein-disulfide isomerase
MFQMFTLRFSRSAPVLSTALLCVFLYGCDPALLPGSWKKPAPLNTQSGSTASQVSSMSAGTGSITERVLPSGAIEIGRSDAPVSMVLFTNHDCAYCKDFHEKLFPRLIADYIRTNKARITLIPFALQKYPDSTRNAALLLCAGTQGKGWAVNDLIFAEGSRSAGFREGIANLNMNIQDLESCAANDQTLAGIGAQQGMAAQFDITLVPSYVLNDKKFTGLPDYPDLRGQMEAMLTER